MDVWRWVLWGGIVVAAIVVLTVLVCAFYGIDDAADGPDEPSYE
jgi:hypothetical protein